MHISTDEEFLKVREKEREGGREGERECAFSVLSLRLFVSTSLPRLEEYLCSAALL